MRSTSKVSWSSIPDQSRKGPEQCLGERCDRSDRTFVVAKDKASIAVLAARASEVAARQTTLHVGLAQAGTWDCATLN